MLDLVLGRRQQVGGQPRVDRADRRCGARCRPWGGTGPDRRCGRRAARGWRPRMPSCEQHAAGVGAAQLFEHGPAAQGSVRVRPRSRGPARPCGPRPGASSSRGRDQRLAPVGCRSWTRYGELARVGRQAVGQLVVGGGQGWFVESREPTGGAAGTDGRHPARAVLGPTHEELGDHEGARSARIEGEGTERHGSTPGLPTASCTSMASRAACTAAAASVGSPAGDSDPQGLALTGEPLPAVEPERSVLAGHGQQVEVEVEPLGASDEGRVGGASDAGRALGAHPLAEPGSTARPGPSPGGHEELGDPAGEQLPVASAKPARRSWSSSSSGSGQVGHRLGEVAVGGRIGQQPADPGHDLAEVDAVAPSHDRVGRHGHLEQGDASAGSHDAGQLGEERFEGDEVAQGEPARDPVHGSGGQRQPQGVGLHAPARQSTAGRQHPEGQVGARSARSPCLVSSRQRSPVPQARSITDERGARPEAADRPAAPADVHAEGHDPVHEVVARARWRRTSTAPPPPCRRPREDARGRSALRSRRRAYPGPSRRPRWRLDVTDHRRRRTPASGTGPPSGRGGVPG